MSGGVQAPWEACSLKGRSPATRTPKLQVAPHLKKGPKGPGLPVRTELGHHLPLNSPWPPGPGTVPWPAGGSGYLDIP